MFGLWWKVRSCLLPPLGPPLLPQNLQGQLSCENEEGPCVHEKVVWFLTSPRYVGGQANSRRQRRLFTRSPRRRAAERVSHVKPERPRGSRAAEQRDERAAVPSFTSSSRATKAGGMAIPTALTPFRLVIRLNFIPSGDG